MSSTIHPRYSTSPLIDSTKVETCTDLDFPSSITETIWVVQQPSSGKLPVTCRDSGYGGQSYNDIPDANDHPARGSASSDISGLNVSTTKLSLPLPPQTPRSSFLHQPHTCMMMATSTTDYHTPDALPPPPSSSLPQPPRRRR
ncbi:hypothetical protein SprV_0602198700 [Sparganum proliferum]